MARKKDAVKAGRVTGTPWLTEEQLAAADPWTRDYITDRRRRGIPAEGLRQATT